MAKAVRSQISRGSTEVAILALLAEQPLYGFEISQLIEEKNGRRPALQARLSLSHAL